MRASGIMWSQECLEAGLSECVVCVTEKDINDALRGEPDTKVLVDIAVDELRSFACHDLSSCVMLS